MLGDPSAQQSEQCVNPLVDLLDPVQGRCCQNFFDVCNDAGETIDAFTYALLPLAEPLLPNALCVYYNQAKGGRLSFDIVCGPPPMYRPHSNEKTKDNSQGR